MVPWSSNGPWSACGYWSTRLWLTSHRGFKPSSPPSTRVAVQPFRVSTLIHHEATGAPRRLARSRFQLSQSGCYLLRIETMTYWHRGTLDLIVAGARACQHRLSFLCCFENASLEALPSQKSQGPRVYGAKPKAVEGADWCLSAPVTNMSPQYASLLDAFSTINRESPSTLDIACFPTPKAVCELTERTGLPHSWSRSSNRHDSRYRDAWMMSHSAAVGLAPTRSPGRRASSWPSKRATICMLLRDQDLQHRVLTTMKHLKMSKRVLELDQERDQSHDWSLSSLQRRYYYCRVRRACAVGGYMYTELSQRLKVTATFSPAPGQHHVRRKGRAAATVPSQLYRRAYRAILPHNECR
jgi:hypothetical protein